MSFGDVIPATTSQARILIPNRLGPRDALAMTLASYLLRLEFRIDGVEDRDSVFRLRHVYDEWPSSRVELPYPCASIVDAGELEYVAHCLTTTFLEETLGKYDFMVYPVSAQGDRTVLMKEAGARLEFQVDFWLDKSADRQAVAALVPSVFSPGQGRSGVIIEGPGLYYSLPMRYSLLSTSYDDTGVTASANERRLRAMILGECDIVSLREAKETAKPTVCLEVSDPADPTP